MLTVEQKIKHLNNLGLNGDMTEIKKMYSGEKFDANDKEYKQLLELSKQYCLRFTELSGLIAKSKSEQEINIYTEEKNKILDTLFPNHGPIFGGGDGLFAIIGTVDLDGYNYINARVHFNASSLVHLEEYVFVAANVEFGTNNILSSSSKTQLGNIHIGRDTWVGANVEFGDYTDIGKGSVIGMGSHVISGSTLRANSISFGSPCKEYKEIASGYETTIKLPEKSGIRTEDEIIYIVNHLKKLGIDGDFSQYIRSLTYKKYNTLEPTISQIFDLSHKLCSEYNSKHISLRRRKEILNILFPLCGNNLVVGDDIFVDCIGTVKIGNDVQIGNHSTLAGIITIGDGVRIGDNVTLQTTGHEIYYKHRRISSDQNGNLCEISVPGYIVITPEIILADGTKVIPNKNVRTNTTENEIVR